MLEVYLDDSGTHSSSRAVVWGGVLGHKDFVWELDAAWKARLTNPCDGKPPIKAFHSFDLYNGLGEFEGYNQAERDHTRHNFRKIIADAGLSAVSSGGSVRDWDQVVTGRLRSTLGSAERLAFAFAIVEACKSVMAVSEMPISFQFDVGRELPDLQSMISHALERAGIDPDLVSYGFSPVSKVPALQAADLVAHETYLHFVKFLDDPKAEPSVHMARLRDGLYDLRAAWFGRKEIQAMTDQLRATINEADPSWEPLA